MIEIISKKITAVLGLILMLNNVSAQQLVSHNLSDCDNNSEPSYIRKRIVNKVMNSDTLMLKIAFAKNCCIQANPLLELKNDTLFLEIKNTSDLMCACNCCFTLDLKVLGVANTNFTLIEKVVNIDLRTGVKIETIHFEEIKLEKNKFVFPLLEEIVTRAPEINKYDSSGSKIGHWYYYQDKRAKKIRKKEFYSADAEGKSILKWYVEFEKNGITISEVCMVDSIDAKGNLHITNIEGAKYLSLMQLNN